MKGIFFKEPHNIVFRDDLPKPAVAPDEVLVKVKNCGICGSDIESYEVGGMLLKNIIIGHEFTGEIVEVGNEVGRKWKVGYRVTADPNLPCMDCYGCLHGLENTCKLSRGLGETMNGAMAEFVNIKADRLFELPDGISFEEGAMVEPLAVAVYAVQESGIKLGETAVVFGTGTIGLLVIQVLKAAGASKVIAIEPVEAKQQLALKLGADHVFDPKSWGKINKIATVDHIIDCVGIGETIMTSLQLIRKAGKITLVGIHPVPFEMKGILALTLKNITIRGIYAYVYDSFKTAIHLIESKKVDVKPIITRTIKLEEAPKAFESLAKREHSDIKVMVELY